ncbi:MAG: acetolactate synthase large subunit [Propionibacterium sp.]|jgi:acetolactate synthase, large subunit, biosynthetic type|uniref:Acetolactate synthase n=1 Tax=Arachnia rubra TaxID=1547448 RepID=A0ABX7Y1L3_9ACTN|nr:acetolactate synthase large subunit [Arachnia rubra]MBB1577586.1 acetolactate synthase large subunit [Propionibacterium sp.]QUC07045.1 acetolactate synthase large subunit [Arachnia rubra]BCR81282.1 acetolactate synthase [Arachnia rubra]
MSRADGQLLTGAQALVESLERVGVEVAFGIPGGAILPAYDPLFNSKIQHILVRHEQGGGHAAEGYAIASGKVGVCLATSGPGATNLVTAIGNAYMDSTPLVAITGQVNSTAIGTDAFQEADIRGIVMPITKHSFLIKHTKDIPLAIKEAFHIASTGRPGPVLVDIAKDALAAKAPFHWPEALDLPGYKPTVKPHIRQIRAAAKLISQSKRPVLYVGGGVVRAEAFKELAALVDKTQIPVVTTLMARGALPDSHPLHMGMPGMHGTVAAVGALQRSDLIIAVGTRFDDRVTGKLDSFAPGAKVIHADIDPAEIGKNRTVDVPIVGDCRQTLALLADEIDRVPDDAAWVQTLEKVKERYQPCWEEAPDGELSPQEVVQRIGQLSPADSIYVTGVGQHQMWSAHFLPHEQPMKWLTSGGAGTMGFCVPAAMGAQVAQPDKVVWGIDGDGCFQMTNQELVTCALNRIPIKIAVINNHTLGMVRQWQTLFYDSRYSNTDLNTEHLPNFPMLAEAMGCAGLRATNETEMDECIAKALEINDRPVVVEFAVHKDAMVWPMVAAGVSNDEIQVARNMAPVWEEEEL